MRPIKERSGDKNNPIKKFQFVFKKVEAKSFEV